MRRYKLFTGNFAWLAPEHIVSVAGNMTGRGAIIRMVNGDQWAVTDSAEDVATELET